jgi:hypothetical protein
MLETLRVNVVCGICVVEFVVFCEIGVNGVVAFVVFCEIGVNGIVEFVVFCEIDVNEVVVFVVFCEIGVNGVVVFAAGIFEFGISTVLNLIEYISSNKPS